MKNIRNILFFAPLAVWLSVASLAQQAAQTNSKLDEKPVIAENKSAACQHGDAKGSESCCAKMSAETKEGKSCCGHHETVAGDTDAMSCGKHDHEMTSAEGKGMSCCHHGDTKEGEGKMSCCGEKDKNTNCCAGKDAKSCCGSSQEKAMAMACCAGSQCGMKGHTGAMK